MQEFTLASQVTLYVLLAMLGLYFILLWVWQIKVLKGGTMPNPDGTVDDYKQHKLLYGIAAADVFLACPLAIAGIVLALLSSKWGFFILSLESFFFVWFNTAATITSLRFQNPKLSPDWFITFPSGAILGLAYLIWTVIHFDVIF